MTANFGLPSVGAENRDAYMKERFFGVGGYGWNGWFLRGSFFLCETRSPGPHVGEV